MILLMVTSLNQVAMIKLKVALNTKNHQILKAVSQSSISVILFRVTDFSFTRTVLLNCRYLYNRLVLSIH